MALRVFCIFWYFGFVFCAHDRTLCTEAKYDKNIRDARATVHPATRLKAVSPPIVLEVGGFEVKEEEERVVTAVTKEKS